jgi:hypothetical protein
MICFSEARMPEMEAAANQTLRLYDGDHREYLKSSLYECALQGISTDARYSECNQGCYKEMSSILADQ